MAAAVVVASAAAAAPALHGRLCHARHDDLAVHANRVEHAVADQCHQGDPEFGVLRRVPRVRSLKNNMCGRLRGVEALGWTYRELAAGEDGAYDQVGCGNHADAREERPAPVELHGASRAGSLPFRPAYHYRGRFFSLGKHDMGMFLMLTGRNSREAMGSDFLGGERQGDVPRFDSHRNFVRLTRLTRASNRFDLLARSRGFLGVSRDLNDLQMRELVMVFIRPRRAPPLLVHYGL
eukprot:COSAG06_NODE_628_length_13649_cov_20.848930_18_plen_236_part_00